MKKLRAWLTLGLLAIGALSSAQVSRSEYPNELSRFKLYAKYLRPLQPYVSDRTTVVQVLGSSQAIDLEDWRIQPFFVGEGPDSTVRPELVGRLAQISMKPKHRVSMLGVKFPANFVHGMGDVSEMNATCDIYGDSSGLEYWVYSEDSPAGKKGDLMEIVYGPSKVNKGQVTAQR